MIRKTTSRIAVGAALTGAAAIVSLAGAGAASASQYNTVPLSPGQATCVSQYAGYQVRGSGSATADGARFKLLRNGVVLDATAGRVNGWSVERRTSWGNLPGPGTYSVCAYNTGTRNTTVSLQILTDGEFF